ncbi:type II and III secretion system protein family protein [Sphingomonas prati]|uniref:Pilus assembly protein CpaC n=1 Tax=Sphingomonas prati TaxID=1843237 RepID=A0A7W9F197_9SPHN|nr:type II and III secretion system protein family protein [Sphingomonas prati]MBB5729272.1 pilus assembly protein CpaC [Sphingomonas prati]GGE78725.1 pilus assembly protein CpaC [Sphingomonas prati]
MRPDFTASRNGAIGLTVAAGLAAAIALATPLPVSAATRTAPAQSEIGTRVLQLSVGRGQMIRLPRAMSDLFVADEKIADVQVRSANQLYVFGKGPGETTVSATDKSGAVVWSATVRVGQNITNLDQMLQLALPDAAIVATSINGMVLLTGTVATPDDVGEATRLVQAFSGATTQIVSRLKTATPLQVNLQVRIAEVSRSFLKNVGVNLLTSDSTSGFNFGIAQGGSIDVDTGKVTRGSIGSTLSFAGKLFGLDIISALDLAEQNGFVTTLANPNLTALSGETASFLAGGEIPIPISQGLGAVSVEYKQYGVSLSFTPFVLSDGRISMRVRPEVSQLTSAGSVSLGGYTIPGISTSRTETTLELGSGESMVIGGLLSNNQNNAITKAPFLGDLPVIGALFRSNSFQRKETELVIVVTPYLVKPTDANRIVLPTDGYRSPNDAARILGGQLAEGSNSPRLVPRAVPSVPVRPMTVAPAARGGTAAVPPGTTPPVAAPGFSF